jgi:hypothetical protein
LLVLVGCVCDPLGSVGDAFESTQGSEHYLRASAPISERLLIAFFGELLEELVESGFEYLI